MDGNRHGIRHGRDPARSRTSAALRPGRHRYAADTQWSDTDFAARLSGLGGAVENAPSDKSLVLAPFAPASHNEELLRDMAFSVLGDSYAGPARLGDLSQHLLEDLTARRDARRLVGPDVLHPGVGEVVVRNRGDPPSGTTLRRTASTCDGCARR
ncbi:hypothetical protein [Streptomyces sp. NPDC001970]